MNRATVFTAALLALAAPALAEVSGEELRPVVAPEGLEDADYDAVVRGIVDFVEAHPDSAFVPVAIARLEGVREYAIDDSAATDRLLALLRRGVPDERNDGRLRRYLRARLRERGRRAEADALEPWRGYLRRWAAVGPFGAGAESELDRRFGPENAADRDGTWLDAGEERRFTDVPPGDDEWVRPGAVLRRGSGVVYALHALDRKAAGTARLRVRCGGSLRLWVNGAEVLRVDRLRERLGADFTVPVALRKGTNRLLVKLSPDANAFAVRLLPGAGAEEPPPADDPWRRAAVALGLENEGLDLEAVEVLEEVAAELADEPGIRYSFGRTLEGASGLPEVHRKNRAKAEYRATLELDPDFLPAAVRLAGMKHDDDKSEEAAADLRARLEEHPDRLLLHHRLRVVMADRGWEKEALAAAERVLEIAPGFPPARYFLVTHHERYGNVPEARKHLERALEANRAGFEAIRKLAALDAAAGDRERAAERYRRISELWPSWWTAKLWLADHHANEGRTDEALTILRALAEKYPGNPAFPNRIANLLRRAGRVTEAVAHYERALELEPGQTNVRRYVTRLEGEEEDFSLPWEVEALDLIADAPGREEYPRAPAVTLLDSMVTRVWPDGSASHVVHMTVKILDEKGVASFGTVSTSGETLEIRTIDPEGKVFEPIGVQRNRYNMPALAPGSVVDYRYRFDTRADERSFDTQEFWFADPEYDKAVLLSRWVVILPEELRCDLVKRNFEGDHDVRSGDGTVVHVFEARNSPRTEREPRMPSNSDLLPWVRFHRNPPFEDAGWRRLDGRWNGVPVAPRVRKEAEKVVEGVEGAVARARALFTHVNEWVTGRGSYGGPTATILERAGDRFQLLSSLLVAAEVPFEFGAACPNRGRDVDWEFAPGAAFRRECLRVEGEDGEAVWIFGAGRFAPFGRIPDGYRGSSVLVLSKDGSRIETLPEGRDEDHQSRTFARIDLSPETPTAEVRLTMATDGGYSFREGLYHSDADDRRQRVEAWVGGLYTAPRILSFEFPDLEVLGADPILLATVELPNFLRSDGEEVTAGTGIRPLELASDYVGKPERIHPMGLRRSATATG